MQFSSPVRHRSKVTVAWLAALLGVVGAHWWYMGRRHAWVVTAFSLLMIVIAQFFPVWWDNPAFLLLIIPISDGIIEGLVFALKPDERFDAIYNANSEHVTRTGWNAVIAALVTCFLGGTVIIFGISMIVVHVYTSMGWLDGYVF